MLTYARVILLGLAAFFAWLGVSYLVLMAASTTQSILPNNWIGIFPIVAILPALFISGGVASYLNNERWLASSAIVGIVCVLLLCLLTSFAGIWWIVMIAGVFGVLLSIGGGFAIQRILHRGH